MSNACLVPVRISSKPFSPSSSLRLDLSSLSSLDDPLLSFLHSPLHSSVLYLRELHVTVEFPRSRRNALLQSIAVIARLFSSIGRLKPPRSVSSSDGNSEQAEGSLRAKGRTVEKPIAMEVYKARQRRRACSQFIARRKAVEKVTLTQLRKPPLALWTTLAFTRAWALLWTGDTLIGVRAARRVCRNPVFDATVLLRISIAVLLACMCAELHASGESCSPHNAGELFGRPSSFTGARSVHSGL